MKRALHFPAMMIAMAVLLGGGMVGIADAQTPSETIDKARAMYQKGQLAEVIELLTTMAQEQDLKDEDAKEAYLLLAKAAAGKNFSDQTKQYLEKILEMDCGFELNLKVEPPQMRKAWYSVEQNRDSLCPAYERPDPGLQTLAVLYFENNSIVDNESLNPLQKGLAAMMVTDLSNLSGLKVVERERIQYILDEIKMEQSQYFDQESAVRVGKLLGAHALLMGGFTKLDDDHMRIDARLIKTETGELLKAEKVEGDPDDLVELQSSLALKIAENLDVAVAKEEEKAIQADKGESMEAVLAYTQGLNLEDEQKYSEAYRAYKEALAKSPEMQEAQERVNALEPIVVAQN